MMVINLERWQYLSDVSCARSIVARLANVEVAIDHYLERETMNCMALIPFEVKQAQHF